MSFLSGNKTWPRLREINSFDFLDFLEDKQSLTRDQFNFYNKKGVLGPIKLEFLDQIDLKVFEKIITHQGDLSDYYYKSQKILSIAIHPEVLSKVKSILGENVILLNDTIIYVAPNKQLDATHSDIQGGATIMGDNFYDNDSGFLNVWVSITGTNSKNAPLHFFPGTHQWPINPIILHIESISKHPEKINYFAKLFTIFDKSEYIRRSHRLHLQVINDIYPQHILSDIQRYEIYTKPGECIFFHPHVLHGSFTNQTSKPRISIALRYRKAEDKPMNFGFTRENLLHYYTDSELDGLGLDHKEDKLPALQVAGNKHHKKYKAVRVDLLSRLIESKGYY